jgi:hypothetical protein
VPGVADLGDQVLLHRPMMSPVGALLFWGLGAAEI